MTLPFFVSGRPPPPPPPPTGYAPELFCEFIHDKRREHRNGLVSLLDELERQKGVSRKKYTRLNNSLSESLDDDEDGEEEMGEDDGNEK